MPLGDLLAHPAVALVAGEPGVHAVGGAVRDVLLGRRPHEVDFVVEGDAIALARTLGGEVTAHERFGTATVRRDGLTIDLASARRERYARPGALPDVELGASIEEDLGRRDFTANAIAVRLADGAVTEAPGARADLEAGLLRVLHDRSFLDDPTRLLRMARYGARLGFEAEPRTAELAAGAVQDGAVETVTAPRMGAELRLLLREPQPAALLALDALGAGPRLLGPAFVVDAPVVERALALSPPEARADLVVLAASCVPDDGLAARLLELGFPAREADVVARAAAGREVTRSLEAAAVAAARGSKEAARWLDAGRHLRLAITGDDLLTAGLRGPDVGRALAAARAAMLDGRAPDRESQLAVALGA